MWMPAQTTVPPGASSFSARGTSSPAGAKMIAASSSLGRRVAAAAGPGGAEAARELLRALVAGAREREHLAALVHGHLADHVRGRPEPVQAEARRVAGEPQRAVADQAAAQQRRRLLGREVVGQRQAEALVGDGQLGVAAVDVASGEARVDAQVLAVGAAVAALAVGVAEPRNADAAAVLGGRRRSGGRAPPAACRPRSRRRAGAGRSGTPRRPGPGAAAGRGREPDRAGLPAFSGWPGRSRTTARTAASRSKERASSQARRLVCPRVGAAASQARDGSRRACRTARRRRCAGGSSRG